jgi:hypothetical protein
VRLRPVTCPKCGGPARFSEGETRTTCARCSTEIPLDAALQVEARRAREYPNRTPIRVGMRGMLRGREYEVIGRLVFSMQEEGETYTWDEWQLLAPDGHVLYLEHDEGAWKLSEPFVPREPIGPATAGAVPIGATLQMDDRFSARVQQRATATLRHVEGELTYAAAVGGQHQYLDLQGVRYVYSVQWTADEIEFYRGEPLAYRQVLVMVNLRQELAKLDAEERRGASQRVFALVCLTAAIVALCGWVLSTRSGRLLGQGRASIAQIPTDGLRFGPYPLIAASRVHRLRVSAQLHEASSWVGAVLEEPGERETLSVDQEMWDESGYDSDGSWHEWVLQAQSDFVPPGPGGYFVRLYAEPEGPTARVGTAAFELYEGVLYPVYLAWYCVAAFVLSAVFFLKSSPETRRKIAEGFSSNDDD